MHNLASRFTKVVIEVLKNYFYKVAASVLKNKCNDVSFEGIRLNVKDTEKSFYILRDFCSLKALINLQTKKRETRFVVSLPAQGYKKIIFLLGVE